MSDQGSQRAKKAALWLLRKGVELAAAAFVAGCTYAVEKEGKSHDMRNV